MSKFNEEKWKNRNLEANPIKLIFFACKEFFVFATKRGHFISNAYFPYVTSTQV